MREVGCDIVCVFSLLVVGNTCSSLFVSTMVVPMMGGDTSEGMVALVVLKNDRGVTHPKI